MRLWPGTSAGALCAHADGPFAFPRGAAAIMTADLAVQSAPKAGLLELAK